MEKTKIKKKDLSNAYRKANYKIIQMKYKPKEFDIDLLKQVAKFKGESMSKFIRKAVIARIDRIEQGLEKFHVK